MFKKFGTNHSPKNKLLDNKMKAIQDYRSRALSEEDLISMVVRDVRKSNNLNRLKK